MSIQILKPRQALNKAFLKAKPLRNDIDTFKKNFTWLLSNTNDKESEEFHKNLVADFLKNTWYVPDYFINTKGRNDLVIHNGKDAANSVGVIIEAKKPTNKAEMLQTGKLNTKAMHELVLYYLRERFTNNNLEVKHLIATNIQEWFIFDARDFEKHFAQNKALVKQFHDFNANRLSDNTTSFFYKEIAAPAIEAVENKLTPTWFDLGSYSKALSEDPPLEEEKRLVALYKILSSEHLLKLPFANDSNQLDMRFYNELLYIIGLKQVAQKGKKLIDRKADGERDMGALLENTIMQLDILDKVNRLQQISKYGDTYQDRLFNIGLELCITWINRILFLKLLEAQLLRYHKGDPAYAFMNSKKIKTFGDLNRLFFSVLARRQADRNEFIKQHFGNIPYLNSSLFEVSEIEDQTLLINNLNTELSISISPATVLKDTLGKRVKGEMNTLEYLFAFLDAYDFSSEGSEDIQESNKTLINSSVLGLIFEKINGYKEGSFFTPGFITMYMCRETIRKAVLQKFKEAKGWDYNDLDALYDKIEDRSEANRIVNSLKICDPAVGSGHFLVSALNEIIAIKSRLRILQDRDGRRLKEYHSVVENDDLVITDEEGKLFEYRPGSRESQRIQEALFHEKQTLIENCLFGVDINPNSVKICRLRLWIELLKNAYYKEDGELETLPNIDINIKCGNSLISRFPLDADLRQALKSSKWSIEDYRMAVQSYRSAETGDEKRAMKQLIRDIKSGFQTEISKNDPKVVRLGKLKGELFNLTNQGELFDRSKKELAAWQKKLDKITKEIGKLEADLEEIQHNKIYENAFEWRFEFPEVLDDQGIFQGFDTIVANPPYMRVQEIQATQPKEKTYYESLFKNAKASYDLANIFFELTVNIASEKSRNAFIFPHKFFNAKASSVFRDYLKNGQFIKKVSHFGANMIFEDADTYTCIAQFSKEPSNGFDFQRFKFKSDFQRLMLDDSSYTFITYEMLDQASRLYGSNQWILFDSKLDFEMFKKIYKNSRQLGEVLEGIFVGLQTSKDDLYVLEKTSDESFSARVPSSGRQYKLESILFKPFIMGKDIQRYKNLETNKFVFFPYRSVSGKAEIISISEIQNDFPLTYQYLKDHKNEFKARENGKASRMKHWHAYIYPKNLNKFEQPKLCSMEICATHPNVTFDKDNLYHTTKVYSWIKKSKAQESYKYLLALANSKILWWFIKITGDTLQGDARTFKTNYLNPFPIPNNPDKQLVSIIEKKVSGVLSVKQHSPENDTADLEQEIDKLVYQLYGLTEEEIAIIEQN